MEIFFHDRRERYLLQKAKPRLRLPFLAITRSYQRSPYHRYGTL